MRLSAVKFCQSLHRAMPASTAAFLLAGYIARLMPEKTGHGLLLVNELHRFLTERNIRQDPMYFIKAPKYGQDILPKLLVILNQRQQRGSKLTSS